jgi:hypothetical protein
LAAGDQKLGIFRNVLEGFAVFSRRRAARFAAAAERSRSGFS